MGSRTIELSEVITDIAAGPFGSNLKVSCFVAEGFPIIDGANLKGLKVTDNLTKFVTEEKARSLSRSIAKRGEVVVTISGTLGQIAYIPEDSLYPEYLCSQRQFRVAFNSAKVYVPYLVYYFHTREGQAKILSFANQTGVPALAQPTKNFKKILVELPEIEEQRKIAKSAELLTEKIELNNRLNDYLAELANTIFVNWLEKYSGDKEFASLSAEDGYLTLAQLCKRITDGSHSSPKADPDGKYPMFSVKDMDRFGFSYASCKMIGQEDFNTMVANDCVPKIDDILVAKDGSYLKELFLTDVEREEAVLSSIAIFRPNNDVIAPELLLQYLKHPRILRLVADNFVSGSALPRIVLKDFKKLALYVPARETQDEILPILKHIRKLIRVNVDENASLEVLRDTLPPKLMNGEIDFSNVEVTQLNNHFA